MMHLLEIFFGGNYSCALLTYVSLFAFIPLLNNGSFSKKNSKFCFPSSLDVSPTLSLETARLGWENQIFYHFSLGQTLSGYFYLPIPLI